VFLFGKVPLMARHAYRAHVVSCNGDRLKSIGLQEALEMVDSGEAIRISRIKAAQLVIRLRQPRNPDRLLAQASITFSEMKANAGEFGGRRRSKKRYRLGNFVDRARTKIEIWPLVGDTKAIRVGPVAVRPVRRQLAG